MWVWLLVGVVLVLWFMWCVQRDNFSLEPATYETKYYGAEPAEFRQVALPDDEAYIGKITSTDVPTFEDAQSTNFLPHPKHPPTVGYFQNMPPSLRVENDYHACMGEECAGDYFDYKCRQKCYLKTMKDGTTDRADLLCYRHRHDEDAYYSCLDAVYGRNLYVDRSLGTAQKCICPDGTISFRPDPHNNPSACLCPPETPLSDRRLRDANWNPID